MNLKLNVPLMRGARLTYDCLLKVVETAVDYAAYIAYLVVRHGEGRGDAECGVAEQEPVAQYAALLEELHDVVETFAAAEFHGHEQAAAAYFLYGRVTCEKSFEHCPFAFYIIEQAVFCDVFHGGKTCGTTYGMASECCDMSQRRVMRQTFHNVP